VARSRVMCRADAGWPRQRCQADRPRAGHGSPVVGDRSSVHRPTPV